MAEAEEVVFQYLQSKFSSILQEAEADRNSSSRIISRFRSIERLINFKGRAPPFPVDHLYELISELSECRFRSAALSRTAPFQVYPVSNFLFTRRMKNRLDEIEKQLKNHPAAQPTEPTAAKSVPIQHTSPAIDASGIIGFESETKKIEGVLLGNVSDLAEEEELEGIRSVGIVGMSGCGKTALAQKVFASPEIQDKFSPRIWVSLSGMLLDKEKRVDTRVRVLNHILQEIGHGISDETGVAKLLEKLQRALMGKRYLIVLDDVWRADEWFWNLGRCLPRGHSTTGALFSHGLPGGSGGGVIVTSRLENAVRRMVGDQKNVICMKSDMSPDECWKIFTRVAGEMDEGNPSGVKLKQMRDLITRKCDGLPLAARTLANVISPLVESFQAKVEAEAKEKAKAEAEARVTALAESGK